MVRVKRIIGAIELLLALVLLWSLLGQGAIAAVNVLAFPVFAIVAAVLAQAAVEATARLLGDRVAIVQIGFGPVLFERRILDRNWRVCAIPIGASHAIATTRRARQTLRELVASLAGVAATAGATVVLVALAWHGADALRATLAARFAPDVLLLIACFAVALFGCFVVLGTLSNDDAPRETRIKLGSYLLANDMLKSGAYQQAIELARTGLASTPDDLFLQYVVATAASSRDDDDAFALVEMLIARELPSGLKFPVLNLWAWAIYFAGRTDLRDEADRASAEALARAPRNEHMLDTRGHVLAWLGRHAEAEPLLLRAFARGSAPRTRTSSACGLALLYAATDRPDEATVWLAKARAEGTHTQLVARAAAAVEPLRRG